MAEWSDDIDERITALERQLLGDVSNRSAITSSLKICESLSYVNSRINSALVGREKVYNAFKKIEELNKLLQPELLDTISLTDEAKYEIISSQENTLLKLNEDLKRVKELGYVLDSEHIKSAPNQQSKLRKLSTIQISQLEESENISEKCRDLLESYNNTIATLSKIFVKWDNDLTQYEIQALPKKVLN